MAFDHSEQIDAAIQLLRAEVEWHALPLHLMPAEFTLSALQGACEAILGESVRIPFLVTPEKAITWVRIRVSFDDCL